MDEFVLFQCDDCELIERLFHEQFKSRRVNQSECFFKVPDDFAQVIGGFMRRPPLSLSEACAAHQSARE